MTDALDPVEAIALLDEPNRRSLYDLVVASPTPVGRDEASAATGMSRELAAFHLDRLVGAGLLVTEFRRLGDRRGPGAGRPAKLYRRAPRDIEVSFPPRAYRGAADILADALERLDGGSDAAGSTAIGSIAVADAAHARGEMAGLEARRSAGPRPSRRRLRAALVDLLRRAGFAPEVTPATGRIRLRSCPYDGLVADHRDLTCGMNVAWATGVLEGLGGARLAARLAPTEGYCCVAFENVDPRREEGGRRRDGPAASEAGKG
jgi:predicted ArsR family transcriptional regulator